VGAPLAGRGHRIAALEDSRLLPLVEVPVPEPAAPVPAAPVPSARAPGAAGESHAANQTTSEESAGKGRTMRPGASFIRS
jgi:hypothetical protein